MRAYGVNRCACVCTCGDNSRALEAKLRVKKKTYLFGTFFGVLMSCYGLSSIVYVDVGDHL
jgi:hypothetical protein